MARLVLGILVWAALALPAHAAEEVVLDNESASVQVSGPWTSTALTPGFLGSDYLYRPASAGGATVFWPFPASLAEGRYELFARWTSGPNRATNAVYFVSAEGATVPVVRNQQTNGATWQPLGTFDFRPGQGQGVTLSDRGDGVVVADAVRWVGPIGSEAPVVEAPTPVPAPPEVSGEWTVTLHAVDLHAGPDARADTLAHLPQFSYLQVLGYSGEWAYVFNPRARGTAYVPSRALGPSDPPPAWVTAPPPPSIGAVEAIGRTVGAASVAFYPVDDRFAYVERLGHNRPILVHDRVRGSDGATWYHVDRGYLPESAVRLPRAPERTYPGRWIDADLREPAMLVAYEDDRPVMSTLTIKGRIASATPTGTFTISRRVADETMDSSTLGVPVNSPDGYRLEHVLYTQYFTGDGASIHYNYWSSNFGYSGSHGCLGVDLAGSEFLWNWASLGTRVVIHT
ncbi:MAG: L,D-transpeptidase family protein [Chloroflexota bacterium]|nr:L,D-transpeptidase family protein [Chloroflexota bacterium]